MIEYTGKTGIKEKIAQTIDEMLQDEDFIYTIQVYENRENEKISEFMLKVINIEISTPNL